MLQVLIRRPALKALKSPGFMSFFGDFHLFYTDVYFIMRGIADGRRPHVGFWRRVCARAASNPLEIREYSLRAFSSPNEDPFARNCFAPHGEQFSRDFH